MMLNVFITMFNHMILLYYMDQVSIVDTVLQEDPLTSEQVDTVIAILTSVSGDCLALSQCIPSPVSVSIGLNVRYQQHKCYIAVWTRKSGCRY